jgi:2-polyprenyl-6-methoxyphenol hydroxylase-like FAD-dependent oxidoreductase
MIHPCGIARLADLGLMNKLLATGAPPLMRGSFTLDTVRIEGGPEVVRRFEAPWLCIRRTVLDQILIDAATEGGATVLTGQAVEGLIEEDGVVRGVRTDSLELRAGLVVGADGPNSAVARLAGAREYHPTPPGRVFLWGYFEGAEVPNGYAALGRIGDLAFLAMPTDAGLYMAGVGVTFEQRHDYLTDTAGGLARGLQRVGEVADFVAPATRVGPVRVMARWHGYFRQAAGSGWVLVGDAGHFKDPTPAQGISDALRQGHKLAGVIEAGLGDGHLQDRLRQWWAWRDDDAWEMYWFATDMGAPDDSPGMVTEMFRDLGRQASFSESFMRILNHELAPSKVFTPSRAVRTLVRAGARRPRRLPRLTAETARLAKQDGTRQRLRRKSTPAQLPSERPLELVG